MVTLRTWDIGRLLAIILDQLWMNIIETLIGVNCTCSFLNIIYPYFDCREIHWIWPEIVKVDNRYNLYELRPFMCHFLILIDWLWLYITLRNILFGYYVTIICDSSLTECRVFDDLYLDGNRIVSNTFCIIKISYNFM